MPISIDQRINLLSDKDFVKTISAKDILQIALGEDFSLITDSSSITSKDVIQILTDDQNLSLPYVDLQSDEGFNEELEKVQKEVDSIIASLENSEPPIPISKIEELNCQYEGDELYAQILLESLKKDRKSLYDELIGQGINALVADKITPQNIGIISKIDSLNKLNNNKSFSSDKISKFIEERDPDFLEKTKESLFDVIDPFLVGQPSNAGCRKKRKLKILGLELPLEFIIDGKKIVHIKIDGLKLNIDEALKKINEILKKQNKNSNPCDFQNRSELEKLSDEEARNLANGKPISSKNNTGINQNSTDRIGDESYLVGRIDSYDSNFFPDGEDPILDQDCTPSLTQDSITGDIIVTKENIEQILKEFCDPEESGFSGVKPSENFSGVDSEVELPPIDVNAIQACLDSAIEKIQSIRENINLTARWQNVERALEEIYYHYDIIYEFQKNLAKAWVDNIGIPFLGSRELYQIANKIILYLEDIRQQRKNLEEEELSYSNLKLNFLNNYPIFTDKIFLFTLENIELSRYEMKTFIRDQISIGNYVIKYDTSLNYWPIDSALDKLFPNTVNSYDNGRIIVKDGINKRLHIEYLTKVLDETIDLKNEQVRLLSQKTGVPVDENKLEQAFREYRGSDYESVQLGIASSVYYSNNENFIKELEEFSARFKKIEYDSSKGQVNFTFSFVTDFPKPLPYKLNKKVGKISITGEPIEFMKEVLEPDLERIKIGNEYAGNGGILLGEPSDYLKNSTSEGFITIEELNIENFYGFINDIINNTLKSKEEIIQELVRNHGVLYGRLIEMSANPWLFFTAEERGDNDARKMSDLKPGGFDTNGEPISAFEDFWGNYKTKWNEKYIQNKNLYVLPKINSVNKAGKLLAQELANNLPISDRMLKIIFDNLYEVKDRCEQIQELLLLAAQKSKEANDKLSSENLKKEFSGIKCAAPSGGIGNEGEEGRGQVEKCPPVCCGAAGSDFKDGGNYLLSSPPSSDCPTIYQRCWWKQFCKDVTKIGLLPYPNGLPPIEDPSFFLGGGPSLRMGFKYWPVGYLPPAFIPIPIPNSIDGQFFIRIPLPMIWTIVDPIVIPLPLNLGILVIFIPFIGGFMPSPLVYIKEFMMGTSFFLTGLRGPRFIPRKSDPVLKDPTEKIKQILSFGIPDKLIHLPGFGQDNQDSPERILKDLQKSFTKIFDNIAPPSNITDLRNLQQEELDIKNKMDKEIRDYKNKKALLDDPEPNLENDKLKLDSIVARRKKVISDIIKDYLKNEVPNPKSVKFPKEKDKLKVDIPGSVRSLQSMKDMKADLCATKPPSNVNVKDDMKDILRRMKVETPVEYSSENQGISNANQIYLKANKDPRLMDEDELKSVIQSVKSGVYNIVDVIVNGNQVSVDKKIRKGAFGQFELGQFQGKFAFPEIKVTENIPDPSLNLKKLPNQEVDSTKSKIMDSMGKVQYTVDDLSPFVRYQGDNAELIIRVKDLKKLTAKKLGLSKRKSGEPERPLDTVPKISNFPNPEGPLNSNELISDAFGSAISAFELPVSFPPKQDQISQTPMAGGVIQKTIPGSTIKNFVVEAVETMLQNGMLEQIFPEINDPNSQKFINLQPSDIQKMSRGMVEKSLDPNGSVPSFLNIAQVPVVPASRPTDIIEQILIGMGVPPSARMGFNLLWKYWKGVPKTPLIDKIIPLTEITTQILYKIPWAVTVLLGRNLINIINPMVMTDDLPAWRRMSLKNTYYVIYLDEFARSAADVSGLFKFFFGTDLIYPIQDIPNELGNPFNIKKY